MTVLKKNLCNIDGSVVIEDIDNTTQIPESITIPLSAEVAAHNLGLVNGVAWIEEHHTTRLPRLLAMLLFWLIEPTKTKVINVQLISDTGAQLFVEVPFHADKSLRENLLELRNNVMGFRDVILHSAVE